MNSIKTISSHYSKNISKDYFRNWFKNFKEKEKNIEFIQYFYNFVHNIDLKVNIKFLLCNKNNPIINRINNIRYIREILKDCAFLESQEVSPGMPLVISSGLNFCKNPRSKNFKISCKNLRRHLSRYFFRNHRRNLLHSWKNVEKISQ